MTFTLAALLVAWAAILVLALAVAGALRQLRSLESTGSATPRVAVGPPIGSVAPALSGYDLPKPAALLFADKDCPGCSEVVPAFANGFAPGLAKLVVYSGEGTPGIPVPVLSEQREAFDLWKVALTPFCVVVGADGRVVAAGPVGSRALLERLGEVIERRNLVA